MARAEADDAAVFQKAADDGFDADVFRQALDPRPHAADAADDQADLHPGARGGVEGVDHLGVDQAVHLGPDFGRPPGAGMGGLLRDQIKEARLEGDGRDGEVFQPFGLHIARQVIEHLGGIAPQRGIAGEEAEVGVDAGGDRVVIAGAVMGIGDQIVAFAAHDGADLGMGLVLDETVNHMRAGPFQTAGLADIGGFVKTGLQFHQGGDGFPGLGRFAERADDGAVP